MLTRVDHSLPTLTWDTMDEKNAATGLLTPAWKRGFWFRTADSRVEPARGRPEMKWNRCIPMLR
jgi:hypothetical protein